MPIGGRMKAIPVKQVTVTVGQPVNQDARSILITRVDEDGSQFYVSDFVWSPYRGFDLLDISNVGTNAPVEIVDQRGAPIPRPAKPKSTPRKKVS